MNALNYARAMASYSRWMNKRLYDACSRLSDEERKRDVGAFFKSIHGTLNHLLLLRLPTAGRLRNTKQSSRLRPGGSRS